VESGYADRCNLNNDGVIATDLLDLTEEQGKRCYDLIVSTESTPIVIRRSDSSRKVSFMLEHNFLKKERWKKPYSEDVDDYSINNITRSVKGMLGHIINELLPSLWSIFVDFRE
jgi:hypothetical protein